MSIVVLKISCIVWFEMDIGHFEAKILQRQGCM